MTVPPCRLKQGCCTSPANPSIKESQILFIYSCFLGNIKNIRIYIEEWIPRRRWSLLPKKTLHSFWLLNYFTNYFEQSASTIISLDHLNAFQTLNLATRQTNKHKELVGTKSFSCKASWFALVRSKSVFSMCSLVSTLQTRFLHFVTILPPLSLKPSCQCFPQLFGRLPLAMRRDSTNWSNKFLAKQQHQLGNILISASGPLQKLFTLRFIAMHE